MMGWMPWMGWMGCGRPPKMDMLDEKYENSSAKIPISTFNHISTTKSGIEPIELNLSKK